MPASCEPENSIQIYLEKACVTYVFVTATDLGSISVAEIDELEKTFTVIARKSKHGLSQAATHAAQTLMWKAVGMSTPDMAERWLGLLRHPLFDNAGHINKARVGR
jgi:hypothetical protein